MNTSFENSSMKNSFSLSSLGMPSSSFNNGTPVKSTTVERPYHSLNKKRKDPSRELWRRSWSSAVSNGSAGDDLWPALQQHYDFIMDKKIIETCKEANGELSSNKSLFLPTRAPPPGFNRNWSLNQLIREFQEMCQWLNAIQSDIYSSPENLSNRSLRLSRMSELTDATPRLEAFVEQSVAILERIPEARDEVQWRVEHVTRKWESVRLQVTPDCEEQNDDDCGKNVDTSHELKCLRRWLHTMEGRLPPPSVNRSWSKHELSRKLREHQVLQRDVECHGRIVNSVVRLCGSEAAGALERRWHLLYLRAIEWQCHIEACIARLDEQSSYPTEQFSETDDEPALKQPRLCRRRSPKQTLNNCRKFSGQKHFWNASSNDESNSEEDTENLLFHRDILTYNGLSSETDLDFPDSDSITMESFGNERNVPGSGDSASQGMSTPAFLNEDFENMASGDCVDGLSNGRSQEISLYEDSSSVKTPPTVIKRRKQHDSSRFNQSDRKSKHLATFYFKHHDTDSDRKALETDGKSVESSEEEWTYVDGDNQGSSDVMTSSVEINFDATENFIQSLNETVIEASALVASSRTPDLIKSEQHSRCKEDIERLVMQAEELVQKKAQQQMLKSPKMSRTFKPLIFDETSKVDACPAKISRINEWLRQNSNGKNVEQCVDSYDASGEYTTESEIDKQSVTSEDLSHSVSTYRNVNSSLEMSSYTVTPGSNNTPVHSRVTLRKKRSLTSAPRPWSVSCIQQFASFTNNLSTSPGMDITPVENRVNLSISESALNMIASSQRETPVTETSSSVKTAIQGHISSTTTINEACTSCLDTAIESRTSTMRRKKLKLRKRHQAENAITEMNGERNERIIKSSSFSGQILSERDDKCDRNAVSDPASRRNRFDTSSTSGNDSDDATKQVETITSLRRSIERTHISTQHELPIPEQNEETLPTPSFKIGPAGGPVRPRHTHSCERERNILGLHLGNPNEMWDLSGEKDSDVDKSGTAGTEEHSSFSEQAWDFYQEKYNSEPYSEAPDSDAARRLLEFGDDYRAFLDSQSDCCSSLSAHPDNDSPQAPRKYKRTPIETKKTRKTISSAERKKSLLDSLERARNNQENEMRRRKLASENAKGCKRLSDSFDLVSGRRRHDSNVTSSDINSSLEYQSANKPDILDNVRSKRKSPNSETSDSPRPLTLNQSFSSSSRSDDMSHDVRALIRRSAEQLESTEALLSGRQSSPDVLLCTDYTDIISTCRENMFCLENILVSAGQGNNLLSPSRCREIRAMAARWSSLRSVALRRGGARRLRRDLAALRDSLNEICDGDNGDSPLMHSKNEVVRRIEILKDRLSRLLDYKVSLLKLNVSVRRALTELEAEDIDSSLAGQLSDDIEALYKSWDKSHQVTSTELLTLEKALTAWTEWESGLRELQTCLREDQATLELLEHAIRGGVNRAELDNHLKDIASLLTDEKNQKSDKCGSLSDSGISDGDSEAGSTRAKRLNALKHLARALHHTLAPGSHALRLVTKRMEQAEKELRILQESCQALVIRTAQTSDVAGSTENTADGQKATAGDPENDPSGTSGSSKWFWRAFKSSIPFHICLLALICAAYILGRPRCCDGLNTMTGFGFLPQLRHARGPPPI